MRYVLRNGELVPKESAGGSGLPYAMSDIKPFVTQDGTEITSRSGLRAYEQRTGTKQVGNDFSSLVRRLNGEN